jgi:hypothetical protein
MGPDQCAKLTNTSMPTRTMHHVKEIARNQLSRVMGKACVLLPLTLLEIDEAHLRQNRPRCSALTGGQRAEPGVRGPLREQKRPADH